jgi:C4-dicarboxylate-specific signal transduction histidine kinase
VTSKSLLARRLFVRLALLFAVIQVIALVGALLTAPTIRASAAGTLLLVLLGAVDLGALAVVASLVARGRNGDATTQLAADVQRIADGDYRHRVGDPHVDDLREIRDSVNHLADRLIADQKRLAGNIQSLEETNRELIVLRDQMVHSARLASVGTLAAGIAHEVGNPLGAIMAFVDVARSRAERAGADTEILDSIKAEARRIDIIVRGLLDYARAPDEDAEPRRANEVLGDVRELLQNQGKLQGVEVSWDVPDDALGLVTEPHRLQQVLVNLLLNAVDALEETPDPQIRVRLYDEEGEFRRLRPRREDDPPGVNYLHRRRVSDDGVGIDPVSRANRVTVIEVSDNGPGIQSDDLDRVFDPFFTTKEPGKGTGLGLSICARLVEGMGGQIDASSAEEGGARFVIRLPGIGDGLSSKVVASGSESPEAEVRK